MNRIVLCLALLSLDVAPLPATENPAAQQTLDSAHKPADLFRNATTPFELDIEFSAQSKVPQQGRLLLRWKARDQWWSKAIFGAFQQITIRNGEMEYTERNLDFTPMAVGELFYLLHVKPDLRSLIARKQKDRTEHGIALTCVQAQLEGTKDLMHDVCIETSSREIRSDEWNAVERRRQQFSDYFEFDRIRFPKKLELLFNGSTVLSANVLRLQPSSFDDALLSPPKGAIERRYCPGINPPVMITTPGIPGDLLASGTATVSITVLTDGSVGDARLLSSGGRSMDQATLASVKKMKFTPAMCGSEPVVSDSVITVSAKIGTY